jgi:hypothetical protein
MRSVAVGTSREWEEEAAPPSPERMTTDPRDDPLWDHWIDSLGAQ